MVEANTYAEHRDSIEQVQRYIEDCMDESLDRETLADVAGMSVPHFHRVFAALTGYNIGGYVRHVRLLRAARKLRMGAVDITDVALAAGYASHAAFGKAFKREFGLSPAEFRDLGCYRATRLLRRMYQHENYPDKRSD